MYPHEVNPIGGLRSVLHNKMAHLFLALVFSVGLSGCCPPFCPEIKCPPNCPQTGQSTGTVKAPFTLAYVDTHWRLQIRLSDDGLNWRSASVGHPEIDRAPGIAANDTGVFYLAIFQDAVSNAGFMMGLGPATWDSRPSTVGNGHRGEIGSGTSILHVQGKKWLVAFRHGNRAKVLEFDSSSSVRDFGSDVTPVAAVTNDNLDDRPAMVNRNGSLIVSWLMTNKRLQVVTGNVASGAPVWDAGYLFTTPERGFLAPERAHDLSTDGQNFYLAVVRARVPEPGQTIKHYFLFIYRSTDGQHWTMLTSHEIQVPSALTIAARGTNDIVAIATGSTFTTALRFDGSSWALLNRNAVFGSNPNNVGHELTLYAKY